MYLPCARWALGVNGQPRGTSPGIPTESYGAVNGALANIARIFRGSRVGILIYFLRHQVYGDFVYLTMPRLALGVKKPKRNPERRLAGRSRAVSAKEDYGGRIILLPRRTFGAKPF